MCSRFGFTTTVRRATPVSVIKQLYSLGLNSFATFVISCEIPSSAFLRIVRLFAAKIPGSSPFCFLRHLSSATNVATNGR